MTVPDRDVDDDPLDDLFGPFEPRSTSAIAEPQARFDEQGRLLLKRRHRKRWPRRTALGAIGVLALVGGLAGVPLFQARTPLLEARAALEQGAAALGRSDVDAAALAFAQAQARLDDADRRLGNPAVGVVGAVPLAGNSVDAARAISEAAGLLTEAGQELVSVVVQLPGGAVSLAPVDGRIPVDPLREIAPAVGEAADRLSAAQEIVEASPERFLVAPVAAARSDLASRVGSVAEGARIAADVARDLPAFLGADGPRRYYFGAQNPAELRGTGGFIGAFSVMTADRGMISFDEFRSITALATMPRDDVAAPNPDYESRYARYGGAGYPQNINMTPDFPSAAIAMRNLYETTQVQQVDGVLVADPFALRELLEVTGPVEVPELGRISAADVVEKVSTEAYDAFGPTGERKETLGAVAAEVFAVFLSETGRADPARAVHALGRAVSGGHLLVWTEDEAAKAMFADLGASGSLDAGDGDYLQVVANNGGANKVDFWTHQAVDHDVDLAADGSATATTTVTLRSEAPTSGFDAADVLGPNIEGLGPGDTFTFVSVYGAPGARVLRSETESSLLQRESELGLPVWTTYESLPAGGEATVRYVTELPDAWDPATGRYTLRLTSQVRVHPGTADVTITVPDGMVVADRASQLERTEPHVARFAGRATGTMELWLDARPARPQWLERAVDVFNRPLFG